jgi:hypothetical protein
MIMKENENVERERTKGETYRRLAGQARLLGM